MLLGRVSSIEGMLWKKGSGVGALGRRNWKMRFFVLIASRDGEEESGLFYFDKAPAGADLGKPLGAVLLDQPDAVAARVFDGDLSAPRTLRAGTGSPCATRERRAALRREQREEDRQAWITAINAAIAAKTAGAGATGRERRRRRRGRRVARQARRADARARSRRGRAATGRPLVATPENTFEIEVPTGKLGLIVIGNEANNGAGHVVAGFRAKSPLIGKVREGDHIAGVAIKGGSSVDTLAHDHEKLSCYLMGIADEPRVDHDFAAVGGPRRGGGRRRPRPPTAPRRRRRRTEPGNPWEAMSIKDLKAEMTSAGISTEGIVEKREMIEGPWRRGGGRGEASGRGGRGRAPRRGRAARGRAGGGRGGRAQGDRGGGRDVAAAAAEVHALAEEARAAAEAAARATAGAAERAEKAAAEAAASREGRGRGEHRASRPPRPRARGRPRRRPRARRPRRPRPRGSPRRRRAEPRRPRRPRRTQVERGSEEGSDEQGRSRLSPAPRRHGV